MAGLNAIAPWFGSKRSMGPEIVEELGQHRAYFEPFCGSCAVLFAKPEVSAETVNDLHGDLINLALVLASERWAEIYDMMLRTLYIDELRQRARVKIQSPIIPPEPGTSPADHHVERAYLYLLCCWMGRNGTAGCPHYTSGSGSVRWTPNGGSSGVRFASAADSIPWWHQRLRRVTILHRDAFDVLASIEDHPATAIYVDPPYFKESRGNGRGSVYLHDFDEPEHNALAASLCRFKRARVVVSYYADIRLRQLYRGWTVREMSRAKNLSVQARRQSAAAVAPEVLLINGPSFATNGQLF